jgi:hypothetical protein
MASDQQFDAGAAPAEGRDRHRAEPLLRQNDLAVTVLHCSDRPRGAQRTRGGAASKAIHHHLAGDGAKPCDRPRVVQSPRIMKSAGYVGRHG